MPPNSPQSLNKTATWSSTQRNPSFTPKILHRQRSTQTTCWCYNGLIRRSRNVNLHAPLDRIQIQRWIWTVPWRWSCSLQSHPKEIVKKKTRKRSAMYLNQMSWKSLWIDANKKIVHFLDVTFDLTDGSYKPYLKPNNRLWYVHRQSNHPPALLKNIPLNINKRLTNISSSKEVFDESIAPYQQALRERGYDHNLTYNPEPTLKSKRKRRRDITWYNPPFNSNLKTNLGRKFPLVVDKCFQKNHPLYEIFNRHTLKLSYSCININARLIEQLRWILMPNISVRQN